MTDTKDSGHPSGPNALDRLPLDPAWIALGLAGVVIVGATFSLMGGGTHEAAAPAPPPPVVAAAPAPIAAPAAAPPAAAPAPVVAPAPAAAPPPARPAREAELEARLAAREAELSQVSQRIAALEAAVPRIAAAEARMERLVAVDALRAQFERGQPVGELLGRLGSAAPAALARYATTPPPTESSLRLSFDEAIRAARGTSGASRPTGLGSLMTVRRGDDVLWGDANEAHVMRARRALETGDVSAALSQLERLDAPYRAALEGWMGQAAGFVAARAALRDLARG